MEEKFFIIELQDAEFRFRKDEGWRVEVGDGMVMVFNDELDRAVGWPLRRVESVELT